MKHYYLGLETDDGLTVVRRLGTDYQKSKDVVDTMNKDMATEAYVLLGDSTKPKQIDLSSGQTIKIDTGVGVFDCAVAAVSMQQEEVQLQSVDGSFQSYPTGMSMTIELRGYRS